MRRALAVVAFMVLSAAGCGEITAFCLQAGAPDGVTLEVTTVPTPEGPQLACGAVVLSDSLDVARAAADSTSPSLKQPARP